MLETEHEDAASDTMPMPVFFKKSRREYLILRIPYLFVVSPKDIFPDLFAGRRWPGGQERLFLTCLALADNTGWLV
jgi:hypothetical protein